MGTLPGQCSPPAPPRPPSRQPFGSALSRIILTLDRFERLAMATVDDLRKEKCQPALPGVPLLVEPERG